jgi:hypothetical protein
MSAANVPPAPAQEEEEEEELTFTREVTPVPWAAKPRALPVKGPDGTWVMPEAEDKAETPADNPK